MSGWVWFVAGWLACGLLTFAAAPLLLRSWLRWRIRSGRPLIDGEALRRALSEAKQR